MTTKEVPLEPKALLTREQIKNWRGIIPNLLRGEGVATAGLLAEADALCDMALQSIAGKPDDATEALIAVLGSWVNGRRVADGIPQNVLRKAINAINPPMTIGMEIELDDLYPKSIAGKPHKELVERLKSQEARYRGIAEDQQSCGNVAGAEWNNSKADLLREAASALDSAARESEKANEGDSAIVTSERQAAEHPAVAELVEALREASKAHDWQFPVIREKLRALLARLTVAPSRKEGA